MKQFMFEKLFMRCKNAMQGYKDIMENCRDNAVVLREGVEKMGYFHVVSKDSGVPLVAFSLKDSSRYTVFEVVESLRRFGWIVPAYTMPADAEHIAVMRVVIREDFSRGLAERLITDLNKVMVEMDAHAKKHGHHEHVKKTAHEIEKEVTTYWRSFVARKKSSLVC
jgi:glutamate decarboxylase